MITRNRYDLSNDMSYQGKSGDPKPTENVPTNAIFFEFDTGKFYYFDGSDWAEVPGGGGGGGGGGGSVANPVCTITINNSSQNSLEIANTIPIVDNGFVWLSEIGEGVAIDPGDESTFDVLMDWNGEFCFVNILDANSLEGITAEASDTLNCDFMEVKEEGFLSIKATDYTKPCSLTVTLSDDSDSELI